MPPHSTACSPKRSVSVSSVKVVLMTPARVPPMPFAYESARSQAWPEASCSTAMMSGMPRPATNSRRTVWPGAFGATMMTSTPSAGLM